MDRGTKALEAKTTRRTGDISQLKSHSAGPADLQEEAACPVFLSHHKTEHNNLELPLRFCFLLQPLALSNTLSAQTRTHTEERTPKAPWEFAVVETLNTWKGNSPFEPRQT